MQVFKKWKKFWKSSSLFFFSTKTFLQNTNAGDTNSKKYTVRS